MQINTIPKEIREGIEQPITPNCYTNLYKKGMFLGNIYKAYFLRITTQMEVIPKMKKLIRRMRQRLQLLKDLVLMKRQLKERGWDIY